MKKEIARLFGGYDFAHAALASARNRAFPHGTKVKCTLTGYTATVEPGSLYADQVYTNRGHMGWRWLEKISEATDEAGK